ncbi:MAG: TDP-N-acetylfucosamine:lipid II N-acetylfucosaminyltransferase [Lachnospiraceae bacterium]|nr:TDP-N-acetylfucosamine:lipid II N-acetylfucosaminyltransferase [Lachnospiraceae bacterium]
MQGRKFLHVMFSEKFTKDVVDMYNCYFCDGNHSVLYLNATNISLIRPDITLEQSEIMLADGKRIQNLFRFFQALTKNTYILIHSYSCLGFDMKLLLLPFLRKIIWIEWGSDLYNWKNVRKLKFITMPINRVIREKIYGVICIFPPDVDTYKKSFPKSRAKVFYSPYVGGVKSEFPEEYVYYDRLEQRKSTGEPLYVLVGHSGQKHLNHLSVLEKLRAYRDENIRVVLSLSYGDESYIAQVKETATAIFGDKAIIWDSFIPAKEYFKLLKRIDIAVFDTKRQAALSNLNKLLFQNTKIYMNTDCPMWQYFIEKGFCMYPTDQIGKVDFSVFSEEARNLDDDLVKRYYDEKRDFLKYVKQWEQIYSKL